MEQSNGASSQNPTSNSEETPDVGSSQHGAEQSGETPSSYESTPRHTRSMNDAETSSTSASPGIFKSGDRRPSPLATPSTYHQIQHHGQTPSPLSSFNKRLQISPPKSASSQLTGTTAVPTPSPQSAASSFSPMPPIQVSAPSYAYEDEDHSFDGSIQNRILFQDGDNNNIDINVDASTGQRDDECCEEKDDNDHLYSCAPKAPIHRNRPASFISSPASPFPSTYASNDSDDALSTIGTDESPSSSPERNTNQRLREFTPRHQSSAVGSSSFGCSNYDEPFTSDMCLNTARLRPGQVHQRSVSAASTSMTTSSSGEPSSESESSPERMYTPSKDRNKRKKMSRLQRAPSLAAAASSLLAYDRSSSTSRRKSLPSPTHLPSPANGQENRRNTSFGTSPSSSAKKGKRCFGMRTFFPMLACIVNAMLVTVVMICLELGPFSDSGGDMWKHSAFLRGQTDSVSVHQMVSRHGRTIGGSKILSTIGKSKQIQLDEPPHHTDSHKHSKGFDDLDILMYANKGKSNRRTKKEDAGATKERLSPRTVVLHSSNKNLPKYPRDVEQYPTEFSDNTQFYPLFDSSDERLSLMEVREPLDDGECKPMQDWQTTFHPSCNSMHELDLINLDDEKTNGGLKLFGTKGFWRNAWRVDVLGDSNKIEDRETFVLKTLKYNHNFEDAHYEHDRVDAVAMERLTASKHVIDIYGFCGHSVSTEYADGVRVGHLADKSKKIPLKRLEIARDIANGLADVHGINGDGIDGDGNTTFVHLDVNPANVVAVGKTLKLNDFNIGILRRWNTTSNTPCGFPAQYPNPQWRSPEEARGSDHLTEKVDIFSMGHIFYRLICGHEPWNKLEVGGKPSKEEMNEKVKNGVLPHIPHEIKESTDAEVIAIRDAMMSCYQFEPEKRPSARKIANTLNSALDKITAEYKAEAEKRRKAEEMKKQRKTKEKKNKVKKKKEGDKLKK